MLLGLGQSNHFFLCSLKLNEKPVFHKATNLTFGHILIEGTGQHD